MSKGPFPDHTYQDSIEAELDELVKGYADWGLEPIEILQIIKEWANQ